MPRNSLHTALLAAACLAVVALVGWRAGAESAPTRVAPQPATIAVVNVERAINELNERKDLNSPLIERVKTRQADLDKLQEQLVSLDAQLSALPESDVEGRRRVRAQLYELTETLNARRNVYQSLINIEKGEVLLPLYHKVLDAVQEIATKQGYDLVLFDDRIMDIPPDKTEAEINMGIERKRILYAADRLDITDEVVLLLNQEYQSGAN